MKALLSLQVCYKPEVISGGAQYSNTDSSDSLAVHASGRMRQEDPVGDQGQHAGLGSMPT